MSNENWQPGDLALCVSHGGSPLWKTHGPLIGQVSTVDAMKMGRTKLGLSFRERPIDNPFGWASTRFIKVTPPEADEFDREVIELMNKKPAKVGGDA